MCSPSPTSLIFLCIKKNIWYLKLETFNGEGWVVTVPMVLWEGQLDTALIRCYREFQCLKHVFKHVNFISRRQSMMPLPVHPWVQDGACNVRHQLPCLQETCRQGWNMAMRRSVWFPFSGNLTVATCHSLSKWNSTLRLNRDYREQMPTLPCMCHISGVDALPQWAKHKWLLPVGVKCIRSYRRILGHRTVMWQYSLRPFPKLQSTLTTEVTVFFNLPPTLVGQAFLVPLAY